LKSTTPILTSILNECSKHALRLNSAYQKLQGSLPITPGRVFNLDEQEFEHLDQYIFRFSKLQDTIGNKLFKSVLLEVEMLKREKKNLTAKNAKSAKETQRQTSRVLR